MDGCGDGVGSEVGISEQSAADRSSTEVLGLGLTFDPMWLHDREYCSRGSWNFISFHLVMTWIRIKFSSIKSPAALTASIYLYDQEPFDLNEKLLDDGCAHPPRGPKNPGVRVDCMRISEERRCRMPALI